MSPKEMAELVIREVGFCTSDDRIDAGADIRMVSWKNSPMDSFWDAPRSQHWS